MVMYTVPFGTAGEVIPMKSCVHETVGSCNVMLPAVCVQMAYILSLIMYSKQGIIKGAIELVCTCYILL